MGNGGVTCRIWLLRDVCRHDCSNDRLLLGVMNQMANTLKAVNLDMQAVVHADILVAEAGRQRLDELRAGEGAQQPRFR